MTLVLGALAGLVAGLCSGYVVAVLQLAARRWRNARLVARGGLPYKDCVLVPLWWSGAASGAVVGAIATGATGVWQDGAIAATALPLLVLMIAVGSVVQRARRGTAGSASRD